MLWRNFPMILKQHKNITIMKHKNELAIFGALCLFLSTVEYFIPKPFPFFRLGLAQIPIMVALFIFNFKELLILVFLKIFAQGLMTGTLFSYVFLFSFCGSFASFFTMYLLKKLKNLISPIGISIGGAFIHSLTQIFLAYFVLFGKATLYITGILLFHALISGFLSGLFVNQILKKSLWIQKIAHENIKKTSPSDNASQTNPPQNLPSPNNNYNSKKSDIIQFICFLISLPAFFLQKNILFLWLLVGVFFIVQAIIWRRIRIMPTLIIVFSVVFFNIFQASGKVFFYVFSFPVSLGALKIGLKKSAFLVGMIYLSRYGISKTISFPGLAGKLLTQVFYYFNVLNDKILFYKSQARKKKQPLRLFLKLFFTELDTFLLTLSSQSPLAVVQNNTNHNVTTTKNLLLGLYLLVPIFCYFFLIIGTY